MPLANSRAGIAYLGISAALACLTAESASAAPQDSYDGGAMREWTESCKDFDDWDKAGPPYKIHGQTYYVGTCGIAAILIASPNGHTLIDSGTEAGADVVAANIKALGFRLEDVKTLLLSHEHFDHVGGMAKLQRLTGAALITSPAAAPVLRTGKDRADDPQVGMHAPFAPAKVARTVPDGGTAGPSKLRAVLTPGHTAGATSWQWQSCAAPGHCKTIVYADSLSAVSREDYRFSAHPKYLAAYRRSIDRVAKLKCDILLTPHPSSSDMRTRMVAGGLDQPDQCRKYADSLRIKLAERLAKEAEDGS